MSDRLSDSLSHGTDDGVGDPAPSPDPAHTPGLRSFGPTVAAFDEWVDEQLERVRGNPVADVVFTTASRLGEFSLIWHLVNIARATAEPEKLRQLPVMAGLIGAESLLVNQGIKRIFRRKRPTTSGDERFDLRKPTTSSFPSGHASSAAFAAVLLTGWDGPRRAVLWGSLAATVAISRPYVRIHHASDIVGGVATGVTLGLLARRVLAAFDLD